MLPAKCSIHVTSVACEHGDTGEGMLRAPSGAGRVTPGSPAAPASPPARAINRRRERRRRSRTLFTSQSPATPGMSPHNFLTRHETPVNDLGDRGAAGTGLLLLLLPPPACVSSSRRPR